MNKNSEVRIMADRGGESFNRIKGISKVISISKIKKINVIRKNWILKGWRFKEAGSKPHSKGDDFSWLRIFFFEKVKFKVIMIKGIKIIGRANIVIK